MNVLRAVYAFLKSVRLAVVLIVLLAWSLPATWKYVTFMKREHSAYLHMRFDLLYSIYLVFALACIVNHVRLAYRALRPADHVAIEADNGGPGT